jgi:hypothetical protein
MIKNSNIPTRDFIGYRDEYPQNVGCIIRMRGRYYKFFVIPASEPESISLRFLNIQ